MSSQQRRRNEKPLKWQEGTCKRRGKDVHIEMINRGTRASHGSFIL